MAGDVILRFVYNIHMDNFDILKSIQKSEQELRDLIEGRDQKALDEGNRLR